jgi:ABC-type polysaccharide/polyol phosphate export permease
MTDVTAMTDVTRAMTDTTVEHAVPTAADHRDPADQHVSARRRALGLVWVLSRKNFQVRYKRAALGVAWAVLQPLFQTALLSFVFLVVFPGTSKRIPHYPVFVLTGMLPWAYFSQAVSAATTSVVDNSGLVRKVRIPSWVFPLSAVGGIAQAFMASLLVMVVASIAVGEASWRLLLLPVALILQTAFVASLGVLTCAFHVAMRDIKYLVDAFLMAFFYATPVLYSLERVPPHYRPIFAANPMGGILTLYRSATLGRPIDWTGVYVSVGCTVVLGLLAWWAQRARSGEFADLV